MGIIKVLLTLNSLFNYKPNIYNRGKKKMSCVKILSLFFFVLGVFLNPKGDISRGIIIQPLLIS